MPYLGTDLQLRGLDAHANRLHWHPPVNLARLSSIDQSLNQFFGRIPAEYGPIMEKLVLRRQFSNGKYSTTCIHMRISKTITRKSANVAKQFLIFRNSANTFSNYNITECSSKKPINTNIAKPCEKWELNQTNEDQEIMMPARITAPHLCKDYSLHCLHQENTHT
ncbi:hypothetical protein SADUNF_Sadunf07G0111600 [Salix dunnii]|uniref:Uncharacterized protein n=1 Tax=Salix dunnii TaxID=1413687 RepID=A0A835K030_9ROSI|nr:hypothetical protein SADUNF_Sadunf07G0111600 [Salix dunnii]